MAYTKTTWANNQEPSINAENLNKMEQGIADAQFPDGGNTGQILSKTDDGTGWVDAPTSAQWGNITGQLSEQTDLYSELESKITMPSGGTTGQVLTKTATGEAWEDIGGGTWGSITGTLSDQTDLQNALNAKANTSTLATVESTSTASQAYSEGDYLVLNGQLYDVIADIASGDTLVVGTNISARTVGEELTALNNDLIKTKSYTSDDITLAQYGIGNKQFNVEMRGYTPLGVVEVFFDSTSIMSVTRYYFNSAKTQLNVDIVNNGNGSRTSKLSVSVLYKKN